MKKNAIKIFIGLAPALFFLALWEWFVGDSQRLQFLFAAPSKVAGVAIEDIQHQAIWLDAVITFTEAALGLICGTVLGTLVGLLLWGNGKIESFTRPYLVIIGSIPIFALAPITIMWFGVGLLSKAIMAGFSVFFVSLLQAHEGARAVAKEYLGYARSLKASNKLVVMKVIVPGAVDWVLAGYRLNVGFALMGAFIGEFISSEAGLGHYILKASSLYDMPRVLFGVFMLCLLGLGMTAVAWIVQANRDSALHY